MVPILDNFGAAICHEVGRAHHLQLPCQEDNISRKRALRPASDDGAYGLEIVLDNPFFRSVEASKDLVAIFLVVVQYLRDVADDVGGLEQERVVGEGRYMPKRLC